MLTMARATDRELARMVEYLKAENDLLRTRIDGPIRLKPHERARLVKLGLPLGSKLKDLITVVQYDTFRRWVRKLHVGKPRSRVGRPRTAEEIRSLIIKMGRETGWGVNRILGELKKLGIESVSRTTVRNILREHGFGTGPERGQSTWDQWLRAHAETLWACDFFSKRIVTRWGIKTCYALVFMHIESRRVIVTPGTLHPTRAWSAFWAGTLAEQARDLDLKPPAILIRDRDSKYGPSFDEALERFGCKAKVLPVRAPNLNAFVERWVKSIKVECLDRFVVFGTDHFDHLVEEYLKHYHEERPHQGLGNSLILERAPPDSDAPIVCSSRLGGVLTSYCREAA